MSEKSLHVYRSCQLVRVVLERREDSTQKKIFPTQREDDTRIQRVTKTRSSWYNRTLRDSSLETLEEE